MKSNLAKKYQSEGRFVTIENTQAFVYEEGEGEAVLCIHGVPASSYVYKQVVHGLAKEQMRGITFDLLGTGLSSRPENADYRWTALGKWSCKVIEAIQLKKFHLIVHGLGGPIGCEVIHQMPDRILSVTLLNTQIVRLKNFSKPFPLNLYQIKNIGEFLLRITTPYTIKLLMHYQAIEKKESFTLGDAKAWLTFLRLNDGGRSFLKMVRSFEDNARKEEFYIDILKSIDVPKQIIWGINDTALSVNKYGYPLQETLNIYDFTETNGSHFLQIDHADIIVKKLTHLIRYKYVEFLKRKHRNT